MGSHPINLAVRFLLELGGLAALAHWGWQRYDGAWGVVLAVILVVAAAVIWGTFAVPDDPSRSGKAPVPVPGLLRLLLELAFFAVSSWALLGSSWSAMGIPFAIIVIIHYLISYDRVIWLLNQ